jgi:hypothetical protein
MCNPPAALDPLIPLKKNNVGMSVYKVREPTRLLILQATKHYDVALPAVDGPAKIAPSR